MNTDDILKSVQEERSNDIAEEYIPFYNIEWSKKDDDEQIRKIHVDYYKLTNLLKDLGFRRMDIGTEKFIVRIIDNVVEECQEEDVIDVFEEYLRSYGDYLPDGVDVAKLIDKVYRGLSSYFSSRILHRLKDREPIEFNVHTKDRAFFYYENGFVEVTKKGVKLRKYSELEGKIWKNQILPRKFKKMKPEEWESSCFFRFVRNVSNAWEKHPDGRKNVPDLDRFEAFKGIIGYMLHSFFDGKLKATILTDSRISDDASGRSGKTLIMKALGHILNASQHSKTYIEINGKDFDTKDRFKYQSVGLDTKLLHINDAQRGLNIEDLFNDITEGISRQRKNESPTQVYAKITLSSNRTIRIHGDSAKDRTIEFEMADYYSADLSPEREFKQWFFRDWDNYEWQQFDNFLLSCVQVFLKNGLVTPEAINLQRRKLIEETAKEFVLFMEELNIIDDHKYDKAELYDDFLKSTDVGGMNDFKPWLKQNRFTKWLKIFAEFHESIEDCEESRSTGKSLIAFKLRKDTDLLEGIDLPEGW